MRTVFTHASAQALKRPVFNRVKRDSFGFDCDVVHVATRNKLGELLRCKNDQRLTIFKVRKGTVSVEVYVSLSSNGDSRYTQALIRLPDVFEGMRLYPFNSKFQYDGALSHIETLRSSIMPPQKVNDLIEYCENLVSRGSAIII